MFCDVVIMNPLISKNHTRLYYQDGWYIEDLQSKNGTYVNQQRITKKKLCVGDLVSIVGFDFYFCPLFIHMVVPDSTNLFLFEPIFSSATPKIRPSVCLLEKKSEPELLLPTKKYYSFSILSDLVIPLIYPMVLFYYKQTSYFIWITLMTIAFRIVEKFGFILNGYHKKRKALKAFKKEKKDYDVYLKLRYPTCDKLAQCYYLCSFDDLKVRIGFYEDHIILHDFEKYPRLLIIGIWEKRKNVLIQIIYQMERFYPWIQVVMNEISLEFILCESRKKHSEIKLSINCRDGKYQIWHNSSLTEYLDCYDALLQVDEGWYFTNSKQPLEIDALKNPLIIASNYQRHTFLKKQVSFLEGVGWIKYDLVYLRKQHHIQSSLKGIAGMSINHVAYLDLHEQQQGPHLLVAGMSGSGKSEWLTSFLLSLCVYYDSEDLQLFVIDFKGGQLSSLFEKLHHTCMVLNNLEMHQIHRTIAALEDELVYREQLLLNVSNELHEPIADIHHLKKVFQSHKTKYNLAHLVIVVDEFAELKLLYPEMMQSLVRIARTGRSLGIHLILCTQRPSGIVDRQMESNIQTRLCLKVATKQDSYDVLGNDEAFYLNEAGEWICQVGRQTISSKTLWVEQNKQSITFYDLMFQEQFKASLQQNQSSMKLMVVYKLNAQTSKVKSLFVRSIETQKIPEGCLGIIDDYTHRKVIPFGFESSILIVNGKIEELLNHPKVHFCHEVRMKDLELHDKVLWFDANQIYRVLMKKINFKVDKEKGLGAMYWKGEIYPCKIMYGVI